MAVKITQKYELFKDVDGDPLENGYIYIGTTGLNPEVSPITVYFDEALTLPAPQPLRTSGGYIQNAGTPANIYVDTDYSIIVRNKNLTLIYTSLSNNAEAGLASSVDTIGDLIGLDEATTTEELEVYGYHTKGDGVGGLFIWDSTVSKPNANGGTIIDPSVSLANQGTGVGTGCWIRQYSGSVNIKWFGALLDGVTDDSAILAKAFSVSKNVYIPSNTIALTLRAPIDILQGGSLSGDENSPYKVDYIHDKFTLSFGCSRIFVYDTGALRFRGDNTINNIEFFYPEQNDETVGVDVSPVVYPPTIYTDYAIDNVTLNNVNFVNSYEALDLSWCSRFNITNVGIGGVYRGMIIDNNLDTSFMDNVVFFPQHQSPSLRKYFGLNGICMDIARLDGVYATNLFAYEAYKFINNTGSIWGAFTNISLDSVYIPLYLYGSIPHSLMFDNIYGITGNQYNTTFAADAPALDLKLTAGSGNLQITNSHWYEGYSPTSSRNIFVDGGSVPNVDVSIKLNGIGGIVRNILCSSGELTISNSLLVATTGTNIEASAGTTIFSNSNILKGGDSAFTTRTTSMIYSNGDTVVSPTNLSIYDGGTLNFNSQSDISTVYSTGAHSDGDRLKTASPINGSFGVVYNQWSIGRDDTNDWLAYYNGALTLRRIANSVADQADSTATDVVTLKNDFNSLLAKLRTANLLV